jgi:hypothetical protein
VNFNAHMSVDQELVTCGVLCVEERCGKLGSEVAWRCEVVVVVVVMVMMTMKPSPNKCRVLWKHLVRLSP